MIIGTIFDNGDIGIGTTNPVYKLDVAGDANISGPLSVAGILSVTGTNIIEVMGTNIITNWPHSNMVGNLNADMLDGKHANELGGITEEHDPQVGEIAPNYVPHWVGTSLVTGTIYDNGNIGIGTAGPGYKLTVAGGDVWASGDIYLGTRGIWLSAWLNQPVLTSASPTFGNLELRMNNADVKLLFLDQANYWYSMGIDYSDGSKLKINRGGNIGDYNDLTIDHTGNLGIGTTSPGAKLDVVGSIWANGSRPIKLNPAGNITIQAGPGGWADFLHFLGSSGTDRGGFGAAGSDDNLTYLYAGDSYINPTMVWKGGNVGIGTVVNPSSRLHIMQSSNDRDGGLYIQRAGTDYGAVMYVDSDGRVRIGTRSDPGADYDTDYIFLGGGNVGIGTTTPSPDYKLDVSGNARITGRLDVFGSGISQMYWLYINQRLGIKNLFPAYELDVSGNARVTGTIYIGNYQFISSDDRIKFNEQKLDDGLAKVMALTTWRYDRAEWEVDPETEEIIVHPEKTINDIGLVAQEVQRIIPEAVHIPENEDTELWGISYATIIPVLIKAIQEQQVQIEALKNEKQMLTAAMPSSNIPLTADFDGDGKTDRALVDSSGQWYFWLSGSEFVKIGPYNFGVTGKPVADDFDGDGKADPGIVDSDGNWHVWLSGNGYSHSEL